MYAVLHSPVLRFMTRLLLVSVLCLVLLAPSLSAHEVRPAYLELTQTGAGDLRRALEGSGAR